MANMSEPITSKTYDVWAWFYDRTFGAIVRTRQARALQHLRAQPGDRVLDIGVGTGMLLPLYPRDVTVVGIDLSAGMLAKAAAKCREHRLDNCRLVRADAMRLPFAPESFDQIVLTHTISVVSDPIKLIRNVPPLLKPGGRIILLNHFQSTRSVVAWFERVLNPIFVKIGWRSDVALEEVLRGLNVNLEYRFKTRLVDLWQIVVLTRSDISRNQPKPAPPALEPAGLLADPGGIVTGRLAVDAGG